MHRRMHGCLCDVRKHRAPKGALRPGHSPRAAGKRLRQVRKHRAPKGALRQAAHDRLQDHLVLRQKAPSAKRCIKTETHKHPRNLAPQVRKHRAPKGALRQQVISLTQESVLVSQKAPSAKRCIKTRRSTCTHRSQARAGQKAPSAKRCIKTWGVHGGRGEGVPVRKHRAPKGALRRLIKRDMPDAAFPLSESTERQKVH